MGLFPSNLDAVVKKCGDLIGLSKDLMASKIHLKPNPAYSGRAQKCPFYIPAEGITIRDCISNYLDLTGELSMKNYKELSDLCAAGSDKEK